MEYKILYIEDADPSTIVANLEHYEFIVEHHDPKKFEESIAEATNKNFDLLLLDFRLSQKSAVFDAPTLAQTIRTQDTNYHRSLPIVLISSEENISGFYKDYTSQDLFDFAISKDNLANDLEKYTTRMKSLIKGYRELTGYISNSTPLEQLLNLPENIAHKFNPKIKDLLNSDKYKTNVFMASSFIINHIVKPSGVLIGEDILAARLGISIKSPGWIELKNLLSEFSYNGIYSDSYLRWWSAGLDIWWKKISNSNDNLRRLNAQNRLEIIIEHSGIRNLEVAEKIQYANSDYFWTICNSKKAPLDPIDGFEKDVNLESWEDPLYYSLEGVSELSSSNILKIIDRKRYAKESENL